MVRKYHFSFIVCIQLFIMFYGSAVYAVEQSIQYYSIHNRNVTINWDQNTGTPKSKSLKGFLNINNINDPDVVASLNQHAINSNSDSTWWMPAYIWGIPGQAGPLSLIGKSRFKVFVPKGTMQFKLTMSVAQNSPTKLVARFGSPPECVNCSSSQTSFSQENSFPFERLAQDVHLQNAGGHIDIYTSSINRSSDFNTPPLPLDNGEWLYVYVYDSPSGVNNIQYNFNVDKTEFINWYNDYVQSNDKFGLEQGTVGDPTDELSVIFDYSTPDVNSPLMVKLTANVTNAGDLSGFTYTWDFGDGTAPVLSSNPSVEHTYETAGTYRSTLTVSPGAGSNFEQQKNTRQITVPDETNPNGSFSVSMGYSIPDVSNPLTVGFTSTIINAGDLSGFTYTWDFGDGTAPVLSSNPSVEHTYATTGTYQATLTVSWGAGSDFEKKQVIQPITVSDETNQNGEFSVTLSHETISRLNPLTVRFTPAVTGGGDPSELSYTWSFGDDNTTSDFPDPYVEHTYPQAGTYFVSLTVADGTGQDIKTAVATQTITLNDKIFAGKIVDTATADNSPIEDVSVYAVDVEKKKMFQSITDDKGEYVFDSLAPGNYLLLLAKPSESKFYVSNNTAKVHTIGDAPLTENFEINTGVLSDTGSQTFVDGKNFCKAQPEKCGIVLADADFKIQLASVKIPELEDRYDLDLVFSTEALELNAFGPSQAVTSTRIKASSENSAGFLSLYTRSISNPVDNPIQDITEGIEVGNSTDFTVSLTPDRQRYHPGDTVHFTPQIDNESENVSYRYIWNFGDENTGEATDPTITHIYEEPGRYNVLLTVHNNSWTHFDVADVTIPVEKRNYLSGIVTENGAADGEFTVYALDLENLDVYTAPVTTNVETGEHGYSFNKLFNGTYAVLIARTGTITDSSASVGPQFLVTSDTANLLTMADGANNTFHFTLDFQSDEYAVDKTYDDGIIFCSNNPEACGIITVLPDIYNIQLRSVFFPALEDRFDIELDLAVSPDGKLLWNPGLLEE